MQCFVALCTLHCTYIVYQVYCIQPAHILILYSIYIDCHASCIMDGVKALVYLATVCGMQSVK